jgi:hypothetical protein
VGVVVGVVVSGGGWIRMIGKEMEMMNLCLEVYFPGDGHSPL